MRIQRTIGLPVVMCLALALSANLCFAQSCGVKSQTTMLEKVQELYDVQEITKVMSKHAYYHAVGKHEDELENIWVQTPENQKTMSFGQNQGFWVGYPSIYEYYVTVHNQMWEDALETYKDKNPDLSDDIEANPEKYYGVGELIMHSLTTPIIEVAEDGVTAKGMWYSPGQVTQFGGANWIWERYGVDFVKECGEWKIWHMAVYTDFMVTAGENWYENGGGEAPSGGDADDPMTPDIIVTNYATYSTDTLLQDIYFPVPYETFSCTFSYGPSDEQLEDLGIE